MKRILLPFFLLLALLSCQEKSYPVKFVALGHVYHVARDSMVFDRLLSSIQKQNPDYVFVLGDMVWANVDWEWELVQQGFARLDCPVYYAPGNHELLYVNEVSNGIDSSLQRSWDQYGERMEYYNHFFSDHLANYILLNSNDSASNVVRFMEEVKTKSDPNLPLLVFSHHNLWEPGKKDYSVMGSLHHKGFTWDEVEKSFQGLGPFIYGDRRKDFEVDETFGQTDYSSYGVGMGDKGDPVYYGLGEVFENQVKVQKVLVEIPGR